MDHDQPSYKLGRDETLELFDVDPESGLSAAEAERRLAEHGPNELEEKDRPGILSLLIDQFNDFLILILVAAAAVSFAVGESIDAAAILVIVVLNAIVGVVQEYKAEQALAALKEMSAPDVDVRRDGERRTVEVQSLVPGDVVVLEAGSSVPADLRLVESVNLRVDEAALTGESVPVQKKAKGALEEEDAARRPREHGVQGNVGRLRTRAGRGDRDRHAHRDGQDRRHDPVVRGGADPAAEAVEPARQMARDHLALHLRHHLCLRHRPRHRPDARIPRGLRRVHGAVPAERHRPLHDRGQPRDRRGAGGPACRRDDLPRPWHAADGAPTRAHPKAPGGGDAGDRDGDL